MQKRFFNTTGLCFPDKHYMVDPLRGIGKQILELIQNEQYFVIHAPRQTGKTTLLHSLARKINKESKYIAIVCSLERAGYRSITIEEANKVMISAVHSHAMNFLPKEELPPLTDDFTGKDLFAYLSAWSRSQKKPIVVLIDEIDALYDDVLVSVLRQLRDGFQMRPTAFPASVALVGLRDVRDYKQKVRENENSIGSGSPFNIKTESFRLQNFTFDEITGLYAQYTEETGHIFPHVVIELIYEYTNGQPWLTNALAREITEKILKKNYSLPITKEIAQQAKENLIIRRDSHLDSLMDKLQDERIKPIIQSVISGSDISYDAYNDKIQYAIDLGIVKRSQSGIMISNKIYNEIIPRVLNLSFQDSLQAKVETGRFINPDGKLDMEALLKDFQKFYRRHSESWINRFSYKEAGHQLLLMAFLQRILNGGGRIEREMAVGSMRTDLTIFYNQDIFVLELKIKRDKYTLEDGMEQISKYLDKLGQNHGYLILFEPRPSTEIPWENRIKWEETYFEYQGVKRKITLVEM